MEFRPKGLAAGLKLLIPLPPPGALCLRRSIWLRPELNKTSDLALGNGEEGDGTRGLHSVRDREVADRFGISADETIEREAPRTVRWIFMVHASEALSAPDTLFRLRPFQHELGCQNSGYRMKVVRCHKAPKFADDFDGNGIGHDSAGVRRLTRHKISDAYRKRA